MLQQRADEKITFPLMWTNACCSHPIPILEEEDNIGVKIAAKRRVKYELNVEIDINDLLLVDKVLYKASINSSEFEEYEIDHVLVSMIDIPIGDIKFNNTEVNSVKFESLTTIVKQMSINKYNFTPWFYNIILEKGNSFVDVFNKFYLDNKENHNVIMKEYESKVKLRKANYTNL